MRLLIVEDERELGEWMLQTVRRAGWSCDLRPTLADADRLLALHEYALIVLDRQLPDGDGLDAVERWRAGGLSIPIILVTALDAADEVVTGLERGADDHLGKPFEAAVLVARIGALLRRAASPQRGAISWGPLRIDRARRDVWLDADLISLTSKEFALLEFLALAEGAVVDRLTLLEQCWDHAYEPGSNVVDVHVGALRRKIGSRWIETVRGAGYRLAAVQETA